MNLSSHKNITYKNDAEAKYFMKKKYDVRAFKSAIILIVVVTNSVSYFYFFL